MVHIRTKHVVTCSLTLRLQAQQCGHGLVYSRSTLHLLSDGMVHNHVWFLCGVHQQADSKIDSVRRSLRSHPTIGMAQIDLRMAN